MENEGRGKEQMEMNEGMKQGGRRRDGKEIENKDGIC